MSAGADAAGRLGRVDTLRLSVTDKCNMRCVYCMPAAGVPRLTHEQVLRLEELLRFAALAVGRGVRRVRVTGGEPLLRRNLTWLIAELARLPGLSDLALTTNGALLAEHAAALKAAGLRRVNVSLDSLDPDVFRRITRNGELGPVLAGIEAALAAGLDPVKINVVLLRGINDDPAPFVELARRLPVHVRFIERMSFNGADDSLGFVSAAEIAARLGGLAVAAGGRGPVGAGPARYYDLPGLAGSVGFIEEREGHACAGCNRLRLSCDGRLRACLFQPPELDIDVRAALRAGDDAAVLKALERAAAAKAGRRLRACSGDSMSLIGG